MKEPKVINQMVITPLGDRVTTKIYWDSHGLREDITLEMAVPQSFALEAKSIVKGAYRRLSDRQKNWPSGGSQS